MSTPSSFNEIVRAFDCFGNHGQPVIEEILEHLRSYLVLSVWFNATEIEVEFDRTPFETMLELQDILEERNLRYQVHRRAFDIEVSWSVNDHSAKVETFAYFYKPETIARKEIIWDAGDVKVTIDIRYPKEKTEIAEALMYLNGGECVNIKRSVKSFLGL
jgi:hypothetical protein